MKLVLRGCCFVLMTALFYSSGYVTPALAQNGGYEGLIVPAEPEVSGKSAPSGYPGVTSGRVEGGGSSLEKTPTQMTLIPGLSDTTEHPITAKDLRLLALIRGQDRDGDGVPDGIHQLEAVPGGAIAPQMRIRGKLPVVYVMEEKVKMWMSQINDASLSDDARAENGRKAYEELSMLAEGLRNTAIVPDSMYKKMGLPEDRIREAKEGDETALALLNSALKSLKKYK